MLPTSTLLARYSNDDVYNADEMGLFYKCLLNKTYTMKGENASHNRNKSKDRLTMPLVIGIQYSVYCIHY